MKKSNLSLFLFLCISSSSCKESLVTPSARLPLVSTEINIQAYSFARQIPGFQGYNATDTTIEFLYSVDDKLPADSSQYRKDHIDPLALKAKDYIFGPTIQIYNPVKMIFKTGFSSSPSGLVRFKYNLTDPIFNGCQ